MLLPDYGQLSGSQKALLRETWEALSKAEFPSLREQLETDHPHRVALDDAMLRLLGVEDSDERESIGRVLRAGAMEGIVALRRTMGEK